MKLPDYLKCVEVQELLIKMGITKIPTVEPIDFVHEVTKTETVEIDNPQIAFGQKLELESVPLHQTTVEIGADGTIEVNGLKACAYIKKQRRGIDSFRKTTSYRYHLCNCQTIEQMIAGGRLSRYVSTTRSDGYFPVIDQSGYRPREVELKLELCKNCRDILRARRMLPTPYSLKDFFRKYQPDIPKRIKKTEQVIVQERYSPGHDEVAKRYKEQQGYVCQICHVDCSTEKECLHLHHRDGDGQNNHDSNLHVLCADCHSKQFKHGHMGKSFLSQIERVARLRVQQGITSVGF